MKRIILLLLVVAAVAISGRADPFHGVYTVKKQGRVTATLSWDADGSGTRAVLRDVSGIVIAQSRQDRKTFELDAMADGKLFHARIPVKSPVVFFYGENIGDLLGVFSSFPREEGESAFTQIMDPRTFKSWNAVVENRGFRIKTVGGKREKLEYWLLDDNGTGINFFSDRKGRLVLVEIPSSETTFELKDYAPAGFPVKLWEDPGSSSSKVIVQNLAIPAGKGSRALLVSSNEEIRAPGILLVGRVEDEKSLLVPLASYLAGRGAVVLVCAFPSAPAPTALRAAFLTLLHRNEIDASRLSVIGCRISTVTGLASLWAGQIRALALLSHDGAVAGSASLAAAMKKYNLPVLFLDGASAPAVSAVPSAERIALPGLDAHFLRATRISPAAEAADPGKEADPSAFAALAGWLKKAGGLR